jgi:trk system potassium uptake protein TrkH
MNVGRAISPAQILVVGFISVILLGTLLLMLPLATPDGQGLSFIDALFMATSAVCVTGLVVVNVGDGLTEFGHVVLLVLLQIGGIGFMTVATMMAILLGKRISIKDRMLLKEALNQNSLEGIVRLSIGIVVVAFGIEAVGALILAIEFLPYMSWKDAVYYGIFHSISAFNNGGFDLFGNSLINFRDNYIIQLTIAILYILGGFGYIVLLNFGQTRFDFHKFSLHSKLVVVTSAILLLVSMIVIALIEFSRPSLAELDWHTRILNSFFLGATARSGGFTTIDLATLSSATLYFVILMMFIGGSPGSTAGGIKTTTVAVAALLVYHVIRGRNEVSVFYRTISTDFVIKSFVLIMLAVTTVMVSTFILTITEQADFLVLLFESVSAFATVGLSMGMTAELTDAGKFVVALTMFAGRVGPLTFFFALSQRTAKPGYRYPEDRIIIG